MNLLHCWLRVSPGASVPWHCQPVKCMCRTGASNFQKLSGKKKLQVPAGGSLAGMNRTNGGEETSITSAARGEGLPGKDQGSVPGRGMHTEAGT